jgi:pimeloyl-ACP methyl ester carboxylesterase
MMTRRDLLRLLGVAGALDARPLCGRIVAAGQPSVRYDVLGPTNAPAVLTFDRAPQGYFRALAERYRVVVLHYPPEDTSQAFVESFTADRVSADILAAADAAGAARFAWFGFSWGGVVGLQLAIRTNRLTALACGGWPPLGGQYRETLAVAEAAAAAGRDRHYATYYRSLSQWSERDAVSTISCPRLVFAGTRDEFQAGGYSIRIGPLIAEHRAELERLGWRVRLVDGFGHELGARPDVVVPMVREFLDG